MPDTLRSGERYIGHMGLITRFGLAVPKPSTVSIAGASRRRTVIEDGSRVERYPPAYRYDNSAIGDLKFALRNEPVDLGVLNAAFHTIDPEELKAWIHAEPTGLFSRRAWFFYEFLTRSILDIPDAGSIAYAPALDPELHIVALGIPSRRHRITDNLLGSSAFCPIVRRTRRLDDYRESNIGDEARAMIEGCDPQILARAVDYLYTKETKSSYAIERETATETRAQRFIAALRSIRDFDLAGKNDYIGLQNAIVDPRYAASDWRDFQNFVGETIGGYREKVHYICPKPEDVGYLMDGLMDMARCLAGSPVDAVVAAAVIAFAFVFVHPFEDGNGRIHRFLIHRVLADSGLTPPGILFPVSAAMIRDRHAYDTALESVSKRIMPFVTWKWRRDAEGEIVVENDTRDLYRFFDATALAEYLYGCVIETVRKDLREEIAFIEVFDRAVTGIMDRIDMPDRRAVLFARLCMQNQGRLSKEKRATFRELTDDEIADLEAIVTAAMTR